MMPKGWAHSSNTFIYEVLNKNEHNIIQGHNNIMIFDIKIFKMYLVRGFYYLDEILIIIYES